MSTSKAPVCGIEMFRPGVLLVSAALLFAAGWFSWHSLSKSTDSVFEPVSKNLEPAPPCPWREPETDLRAFFPGATRYEVETRILSSRRLDLQERLGRPVNPDELSLRLYRVFNANGPSGALITRRVKGEHGAIELVLPVGEDGVATGLRVQSLREPKELADALQDPGWLKAFAGKRASDPFALGRDLPSLPEGALRSGRAIAEGVRSALIMLDMASSPVQSGAHHE